MLEAILVVALLAHPPAFDTGNVPCADGDWECLAENGGTYVGVGGRGGKDDPGNGIGGPEDGDGTIGGTFIGAGAPSIPPLTLCNTDDDTFPIIDPLAAGCVADDVVTIPYPTLSDLARFTPQAPTLTGEPYTAGVIGKPTNFLSTASEHTLEGELFTYPVSVRFTPVNYTFDYGDGTSATVTDAYDSWVDAGLPQFTPTDASHTYSAKGQFEVSVTVAYSAEVNFSGSDTWLPVDGFVRATTSGYSVTIYEVITALVDRDCIEDPTGLGCP